MPDLTPREIVVELDRHIVGQDEAKRAVAVAIRNRWRRQQLAEDMRQEVAPKNILMIGPTGVGKTEIARRLAQAHRARRSSRSRRRATRRSATTAAMSRAWSASWSTMSIGLVRQEEREAVREEAGRRVEERLLDLLAPAAARLRRRARQSPFARPLSAHAGEDAGDARRPASWTSGAWRSPSSSGRRR